MPLVRGASVTPRTEQAESRDVLLEQLAGRDPVQRRHAARALAHHPDAAPILAARLHAETEPSVRDALFASIVEIGGMRTAELLVDLLRSGDAGLRGGAVEALKQLDNDAIQVLDALLVDPDPDMRILAVEVTRAWPSQLAVPRLRRVVVNDPHVNVCAAAVDVATEVGTNDLLEPLSALLSRFPREPFLVFAVGIASTRIKNATERHT